MQEHIRAIHKASRDASLADAAERVRIQASLAERLLNGLLIAHGGAIIGLFTFVGNMAGKSETPLRMSVVPIWLSFSLFVLGLALSLAAYLFAFLSQDRYYRQAMDEAERFERAIRTGEAQTAGECEVAQNAAGHSYYRCGLGIAVASITLFAAGGGCALLGLLPGR